ncbi:MAG: cobyric acid synthase [Lachnospiraceae bacterium]
MAAKKIMIQGTMSNSGKSFLVAALCRIFKQDGYRVAPFKSQNMALNSYITEDGLEIGRAQAMQAEAAGIRPAAAMNPILLKPTSHMGSQVIVNGEVFGNLKAMDYYRRKPEFIPDICRALQQLEDEYDIIVLEGAGSPAEINLKEHDIVNMGMARIARSPVLLVGDIDRGGVFASLYGTVCLLEPEEQAMIKGLIINKFRGDQKILEPGLRMIEDLVDIPVTGVIPMETIDLDDEDSLSDRLQNTVCQAQQDVVLDIAVIHFPHISNFTDFNSLERMAGVSLRYVDRPERIGLPDLVILPGTKNTMADLSWMREHGIEAGVVSLLERQVPIVGICGGYQMLGRCLEDPDRTESGGSMTGMCLLDADTIFAAQKTRTRTSAAWTPQTVMFDGCQGKTISGYEIHMGVTRLSGGGNCSPVLILENGDIGGLERQDGLVFGSYLHGLFDNQEMARTFLNGLAAKKGITIEFTESNWAEYKEEQYDKLADLVRSSLDMEAVYRILEQGI